MGDRIQHLNLNRRHFVTAVMVAAPAAFFLASPGLPREHSLVAPPFVRPHEAIASKARTTLRLSPQAMHSDY
jgi:hypothetical protein